MKLKSKRLQPSAHRRYSTASLIEVMEERRMLSATITLLGSLDGTYGTDPRGNLNFDASGNLVGTATSGGSSNNGTLYSYNFNSKSLTLLASFDGTDGSTPYGPVVVQTSGDILGLSGAGGGSAYGTFYHYDHTSGTITALGTLIDVNGSNPVLDGAFGMGGLTASSDGFYYAATPSGGSSADGTVVKFSAGGTITPVGQFNGSNGSQAESSLLVDSSGNLFGTTVNGGTAGEGVVYEVAANTAAIIPLASFIGPNGANPRSGLVADANGNLFGCTTDGGAYSQGDVYEVTNGNITDIADFNNTNGSDPLGDLLLDSSGNLFGTTSSGGSASDGTVFEIPAATHVLQTIATFDGTNGSAPQGGLIADSSGNLFGTTSSGGVGNLGGVYEVTLGGSAAIADSPVFSTQPIGVQTGNALPPITISEETTTGQIDAAATGSITLSLSGGLNASVAGTLTEPLVNGTATFTDISVSAPGNYTFSATDGTTPVASAEFSISSASPFSAAVTGALPATSIVAGQPAKLSQKLTLTNTGPGLISGTVNTQLYLSTGTTLNPGSTLLATEPAKHIKLKTTKASAFKYSIKSLPTSTPAGTYYIVARVTDPFDNILDSSSVGVVNVVAPRIDLNGSFVSVSRKVKSGKSATFSVTVISNGNIPTIGTLPVQIDLSTDGADDQNLQLTPLLRRINLKPGKKTKVVLHAPLTGIAAGAYQIFVRLDPANTLGDANTTDNNFNSPVGVLTVTI